MVGSAAVFLILAIFLGGVTLGLVAVASVGSRLEDRRLSLSGRAPSAAARGARMLNGFGAAGLGYRSPSSRR